VELCGIVERLEAVDFELFETKHFVGERLIRSVGLAGILLAQGVRRKHRDWWL